MSATRTKRHRRIHTCVLNESWMNPRLGFDWPMGERRASAQGPVFYIILVPSDTLAVMIINAPRAALFYFSGAAFLVALMRVCARVPKWDEMRAIKERAVGIACRTWSHRRAHSENKVVGTTFCQPQANNCEFRCTYQDTWKWLRQKCPQLFWLCHTMSQNLLHHTKYFNNCRHWNHHHYLKLWLVRNGNWN
jgi:hypothetical protein